METDRNMFIFLKEFIFLDFCEVVVDVNVNVLRKKFINRFHKAVPPSRTLITISLIDDIIPKLHNKIC